MHSTDEKKLRRFYQRKLTPAAQSMRRRGVTFFAIGPTAGEASWYVEVPSDLPELVEVEAEHAERQLRLMWEAQGLPELAKLAGDLMKLAGEIELEEDQSGDVSPFIYVMY